MGGCTSSSVVSAARPVRCKSKRSTVAAKGPSDSGMRCDAKRDSMVHSEQGNHGVSCLEEISSACSQQSSVAEGISDVCNICYERPCDAIFPCLHRGCGVCFRQIAAGTRGVARQCPICRRKLKPHDMLCLPATIDSAQTPDLSTIAINSKVIVTGGGPSQHGVLGRVVAVEGCRCLIQSTPQTGNVGCWSAWYDPREAVAHLSSAMSPSRPNKLVLLADQHEPVDNALLPANELQMLAEPGEALICNAPAELALAVHVLSVLRLRACRIFGVKTEGYFVNVHLVQRIVAKKTTLGPIFDSILDHGDSNEDPMNLRAHVSLLFGRLLSLDREPILKLREQRDRCGVRDTAELLLLCFAVLLRNLRALEHMSAAEQQNVRDSLTKARLDVSDRVDRLCLGMWMLDKATGAFNERATDPYSAATAVLLQQIKALSHDLTERKLWS